MKTVFIVTGKCLILSAIIVASCAIADTIDFNMDFSGTRTVSFQYEEDPEFLSENEAPKSFLEGLIYIDSLALWVEDIENFHIDTSEAKMAHITYDFPSSGIKIKNQKRYDFYKSKVPEEFAWYFEEQPNTFEVVSEKQLLWRAINKDLDQMNQVDIDNLATYLNGISIVTQLTFPHKILSVDPHIPGFEITKNGRSIKTEIELEEIALLKIPNEVLITLE